MEKGVKLWLYLLSNGDIDHHVMFYLSVTVGMEFPDPRSNASTQIQWNIEMTTNAST